MKETPSSRLSVHRQGPALHPYDRKNPSLSPEENAHNHHKTNKSLSIGGQAKICGLACGFLLWTLPTLHLHLYGFSIMSLGFVNLTACSSVFSFQCSPSPLTTCQNLPAVPLMSVSAQVHLAGIHFHLNLILRKQIIL